MLRSEKGQSLLEMIVVVAVGTIIVGALTFATIASLRNAQYAKSQSQATKLGQEGMEKVRSIRDRDTVVRYAKAPGSFTDKFSDLWSINFSCPGNCYFTLAGSTLVGGAATSYEEVDKDFKRQVQVEDGSNFAQEKKVTVIVVWNDFSGSHESRITTLLRKP
ncbi:prepilin-type N-terminal cleavage/methylation domain-containing protein [Candidatus Daviesbacteria bacterium]|nr:prepilin-type N-terminal cleavage/methylation domain-containing protein [Candidatus Daviesbacteria bacterium]